MGALAGSWVISVIGARRTLIAGAAMVAVAGALRGLGPSVPVLYCLTLLMGLAIACVQPAIPTLIAQWLPGRVGLATGFYSNGLLIAEAVAAAVTLPWILPVAGGSWEVALALWSLPVALTVPYFMGMAGPEPKRRPPSFSTANWRRILQGNTWRLGIVLGGASSIYYGANAFIPEYLSTNHHQAMIGVDLTALNLGQLPAAWLLAILPGLLLGRRWPFFTGSALAVAGLAGFVFTAGAWPILFAATLGFTAAFFMVLTLALPPLLAEPGEVHLVSACVFFTGYGITFLTAVGGGALWDASGVATAAFVPILVAAVGCLLASFGFRFDRARAGETVSEA